MSKLRSDEDDIYYYLLEDDVEAIRLIHERLGGYVKAYLCKSLQLLPEVAEHIYFEALFKFWDKREQYDEHKGTLRQWLFTIAYNTGIDYLREEVDRRDQEEEVLQVRGAPAHQSPSEVERGQTNPGSPPEERVAEAASILDEFTERERAVLQLDLHFAPGRLPAQRMAELLGTTQGNIYTIRSRVNKKMGELREKHGTATERGNHAS